MTDLIDEFMSRHSRRAILMEIGGFRPMDYLTSSWFGSVNLGAVGESWPNYKGQPLQALAQVNLTELPFCPSGLGDIEFITVFITSEQLPLPQDQNGSNWVLRAYTNLESLIPIEKPVMNTSIKPFPMQPRVIENDYPSIDDIPFAMRKHILAAQLSDQYRNNEGFKLGGWPTTVQSEIDWGDQVQFSIRPEFIFQIDSTEKGNWMWGDNGIGYFGRGTVEGYTDQWVLDWQCF